MTTRRWRSLSGAGLLALLAGACTRAESDPGALTVDAGPIGARVQPDPTDSLAVQIDGDTARVLRLVPVAADDPERARLCGYLVSEPTAALRVPLPAGFDTTAPRVLLDYVQGAHVRGLRYLVPGFRTHYVFEGLTRDGRFRVRYRQPVQLAGGGPAAPEATDSMLARGLTPSLDALDAFAQSVRRRGADAVPPLAGTLPDSVREPDLAVPDIRDLPDATLTLDGACPAITIGSLGLARIERLFRVRVPAGHTLRVRARASIGGLVLGIDRPAVPDSARRTVRPVQLDSVVATVDRDVTLRVLFAPVLRKEPDQAFITLSVALARTLAAPGR